MRGNIKSSVNDNVFNIASNLFNRFTDEAQQVEIEAKKEAFLNDNPNILQAVYPCIIDEAFSKTMDNYRSYVANYNIKVEVENKEINVWNSAASTQTLSDVEKVFTQAFVIKHKHLSDRKYNAYVEEHHKERGVFIEKRPIKKVRSHSRHIFTAFIAAYNDQLIQKNKSYIDLGVTTKRPVPGIKINSRFITKMKQNGISIDLCSKTIRNHRDRMEEAGILLNKKFNGSTYAVEYQINSEILVIFDFKTQQLTTSENQSLTKEKWKVLPDNDVSTRTLLKENKMNENGKTDFQEERSSASGFTIVYYGTRTPVSKIEKPNEGGAAENVNFSEKLLSTIEHEQELSEKLSNNEYINHTPIDIRLLTHEAYKGTLSNEEFRQVVIQDFFRTANKLFKNSPTVYVGSWRKTINRYLQAKFMLYNDKPMQKVNILEDIQELRWSVEWSRKWFLQNPDVKILYPNDYFDFSRQKTFEIGFEYIRKTKYKEHLQKIENKKTAKSKADAKAKRRAYSYRFNAAISRFINNKTTFDQLKAFVKNNLPKEFNENLLVKVNAALKEHEKLQQNKQMQQTQLKVNYNLNDFTC